MLLCYNFPAAYKTVDIEAVFAGYKDCFKIKWVDDTSAIVIFEDPALSEFSTICLFFPIMSNHPFS